MMWLLIEVDKQEDVGIVTLPHLDFAKASQGDQMANINKTTS